MATKGDVRELRGIKFIVLTGPRDKRHGTLHRATWERHQHGWEAEDRRADGHRLLLSLLGFLEAKTR